MARTDANEPEEHFPSKNSAAQRKAELEEIACQLDGNLGRDETKIRQARASIGNMLIAGVSVTVVGFVLLLVFALTNLGLFFSLLTFGPLVLIGFGLMLYQYYKDHQSPVH